MMSTSLVIKNFNDKMNYFEEIKQLSLTDDEIVNEFKHFSNHNRVIYCSLLVGYHKIVNFVDDDILHELVRSKIVKITREEISEATSYRMLKIYLKDDEKINKYYTLLEDFMKYLEYYFKEQGLFTKLRDDSNYLYYLCNEESVNKLLEDYDDDYYE